MVEQPRLPQESENLLLRRLLLASRMNWLNPIPIHDAVVVCVFEGASNAGENGVSGFASGGCSE